MYSFETDAAGQLVNIDTRTPRIRACLFDMDGLLIDSEDRYTQITNEVLQMYGKPNLPWSVKAQLQGRPQPEVRTIIMSLPIIQNVALTAPIGKQDLP
jgi:pseudouridine-5'-monophosphatase